MEDYGQSIKFMTKYKQEVTITIEDEYPPRVSAHYNNEEIGHLEFIDYLNGSILLEHASVNPKFQRLGIGTCMMKEVVELLNGELYVPNFLWSSSTDHEVYLSGEGASLINSCVKQGILSHDNEADYDEKH